MAGTVRLWDNEKNAPADVPIGNAKAAFESGKFSAIAGNPIPMRVGADILHVDPKHLGDMFRQGATFAAEADVRESERARKHGGVGKAFGLGALRGAGAALGLSTDRAIANEARYAGDFKQEQDLYRGNSVSSAGDRAKEMVAAAAIESPIATLGGEAAGMLAAGALTGGGGAIAAGEEAGAALGSRALGRMAGMAADGALIGAVDADNEASRAGERLTGEKLVAGASFGAFLGGTAGAGLSALGHLGKGAGSLMRNAFGHNALEPLGRMTPRSAEAIEGELLGRAARNADGVLNGLADASGDVVGEARAAQVRRMVGEPGVTSAEMPAAKAARRVEMPAAEAAIKEAYSPIEAIVRERDAAALHLQQLRAQASGAANLTANQASPQAAADLELALANAEKRLRAADHPLVDQYRHMLDKADGMLSPTDVGGWAGRIAEARRDMREVARFAARRGASPGADPRAAGLFRSAAEEHSAGAKRLGEALEDEGLFGRAAVAEKELGRLRDGLADAEANALGAFATRMEVDGKLKWVVDPDKLRARLKAGLNEGANAPEALANLELKKYMDRAQALMEAAERHGVHEPERIAEGVKVRARAKAFLGDLEEAANHYDALRQAKAAGGMKGGGSGGALGAAIGGALGGAAGGPMGGAVGGILGAALENRHFRGLARAAGVARAVDEKFAAGIAGFFAPGKKASAPSASAAFLAGAGGERATFERSAEAMKGAAADPGRVARLIQASLGDIAEEKPGVGMHVAETIMRGVNHLVAHLPPGMTPTPGLAAPQFEKPSYSDSEMRGWARRAAAINDPHSILLHMRQGYITPEEVDAVREVYPDLYEKIDLMLRKELATLQVAPSREQRLQLSVAFGIPADASLTPEVLGILQMPAPGRAGGRGGKSKGPLRTPMLQRLDIHSSHQTATQTPYGNKR